MKYTTPTTIDEWVSYILDEIPTSDLTTFAQEMGGTTFIRLLKEEGYDAEALLAIHRAVALRFVREGLRIPQKMDNCHVDYNALVMYQDAEEIPKG